MLRGGIGNDQILLAVADAAVIFAPIHFASISREIRTADMVMRTDFGAAQAAKETFSLIGASLTIRISLTVINALG